MITPKVCIAIGNGGFREEDISAVAQYISEERMKRAGRYYQQRDRDNCIVSYFLLRYGLMKYYGISEVPAVSKEEHEKPYFEDSSVFFNISHSDTAVCCGIADENIGVDIQSREVNYENIVKSTMSEAEAAVINSSPRPNEEFTRFWTLKESIVKYRGTGIGDNIQDIDFSASEVGTFLHGGLIFRSEWHEGYCISACTEKNEPEFIIRDLSEYIEEFRDLMK